MDEYIIKKERKMIIVFIILMVGFIGFVGAIVIAWKIHKI